MGECTLVPPLGLRVTLRKRFGVTHNECCHSSVLCHWMVLLEDWRQDACGAIWHTTTTTIQKKHNKYNVVVVLTLTRIIKSVVTGQAPVTLELRNTPGKKTRTTRGSTRIYHSWRNSCLHQKQLKVNSGVSQRCARSIPVHTSHYSCLQKPTTPFPTQERLPRIHYT